MPPIPPIFTLQVPAYESKTSKSPGGTFTLTSPSDKTYLLTFNAPPDNRLTPPFLDTFSLALDIILTLPPKVLLTTSSIEKFYSNGLDYAAAMSNPDFQTAHLFPLWRKLVTYPLPTVAIINGHGFAGGLMTAMVHDYRIMNPKKGFVCLNELDFNSPLSPAMATIFRVKLSMATFRTLILEGKRFTAQAALEDGIIDGLGGLEEALKLVKERGVEGKLRKTPYESSYGRVKEEMYREIVVDLEKTRAENEKYHIERHTDRENRRKEGEAKVKKWKESSAGNLNSKL